MLLQPYHVDELRFAYCYRVFLRWRTHRIRPIPELELLNRESVQSLMDRFNIHVLEWRSDPTDAMALISLRPEEAVATCVSKLKGQLSKSLRLAIGLVTPEQLLSRGYYAYSTGENTRRAIELYLDRQSIHHGYSDCVDPPVFVESYELDAGLIDVLNPIHARCQLDFQIVLATSHRLAVFVRDSAQTVASQWRRLQKHAQFALLKVSFVPDHVHLTVRLHPAVVPARLVLLLMNSAQEWMFRCFPGSIAPLRTHRLWQPGAYLGSFGDLAMPELVAYMARWTDGSDWAL